MKRKSLAFDALVLAAAFVPACVGNDLETQAPDRDPTPTNERAEGLSFTAAQPGVSWKRPEGPSTAISVAAAVGAKLTYRGGAVMSNVKVYIVQWGPNVWPQGLAKLQGFFQAVPKSAHFDWLSEYNTPTQSIGEGSFGGTFLDSNPPTAKTIDDTQIRTELKRLIVGGLVPSPDANSYYQILFPPGVTVTSNGDAFCKQTSQGTPCAYHNSFVVNGVKVRYSPQPDYSGQCGSLCGFVPGNNLASLTTASSHELVEAVTDPEPGSGWYDNANGEIGDICEVEAQGQQIAGFFVQTEWSNKKKACIISNGSSGTGGAGGGGGGGTGGAGGGGGSTCSHSECVAGAKLQNNCDACVRSICAADSFCCSTRWDGQCVGEVSSICHTTCR